MSDEFEFDGNDGQESEGIKSLRKAYDAQKKQLDEALKRVNEFETREKSRTVSEILTSDKFGGKAAWAEFYAGEPTEDAIGAWLQEKADAFGWQPPGEKTGSTESDPNALAAQQVAAASFGYPPATTTTASTQGLGDPAAMEHALKNMSMEDLRKLGMMPAGGQIFSR